MSETKLRLDRSNSGVFDANGVAVVELRNNGLSRWVIQNTSVTTTSTKPTECNTYRGAAISSNLIDSTRSGNGRSSDTVTEVRANEYITVRWENGTPGAVATATITGDDFHRGRRAY